MKSNWMTLITICAAILFLLLLGRLDLLAVVVPVSMLCAYLAALAGISGQRRI